jgi:hypothetical protein
MIRHDRNRILLAAALLAALLIGRGEAADKPAKKKADRAEVANPVDPSAAAKNAREMSERIDRLIDARQKAEKVPASPQADDAEFLRRVSLDITGVIPSAEPAKAFLDSKESDKRSKLIDELLASSEYGKRMADTWQELLLTRTSDNRRMNAGPFVKWLTASFNDNKPWNRMVHELLTASGDQEKNPEVTYFLANGTVDKITDNVTKNLLGVQLQCAQCHNHPFTGWKQTEYWGMATFFMKVRPGNVNQAARNGTTPGVSEGPQIVRNRRTLPESAKMVNAKFLQGEEPKLTDREPYRPILADWVTAEKNPFFAKAMVNRVWSQFFGRGLVNPVDDMHEMNSPSHPELLEQLAAGFVASKFDVKELIRAIASSKAYQRTSKPVAGNEEAEASLYARMNIKVLSAEMLYDSMVVISGAPTRERQPNRPGQRGQARTPREAFVAFFRADEGADPTEYAHGIPQALRLMNSSQFSRAQILERLLRNGGKPEEIIEGLYLTTLSRRPTQAELSKMMAHVQKSEERQGYSDVLWVLMNCSEFALNR